MAQTLKPLTQMPAAQLDVSRPATPVSAQFGDIYFSVDGGLDETRSVYLKACGLPEAWHGKAQFVIGELGFGTGLNFLASAQLWQQTRPSPTARLHFVSAEGFPLSKAELEAALSHFPELGDIAAPLIAAWPGRVYGRHRLELPFGICLTLLHDDVEPALSGLDMAANAWFLDGFSPSKNPAMWSEAVMAQVYRLSAPGARIGTFTVAGDVRRALALAGFDVTKQPGFGRKRERLEAIKPGACVPPAAPPDVLIIGAGIAGASLAAELHARGLRVTVIAPDDDTLASGNPAAIVKPRLDLQDRPEARFFNAAYLYALSAYPPQATLQTGIAHLAKSEDEARRMEKLAAQQALPSEHMVFDPDLASRAGLTKVGGASERREGLWFGRARVIDPGIVTRRALQGSARIYQSVLSVKKDGKDFAVLCDDGHIHRAGAVILCAGAGVRALCPELALRFQRGQITRAAGHAPKVPITYGGYALPFEDGVLLGATHDRFGPHEALQTTAQDDEKNMAGYRAVGGHCGAALAARASVRVTTPSTLPQAGQYETLGLYCLTGLGGRGFVFAPLLAAHIASLITGEPSPLAGDAAAALLLKYQAREDQSDAETKTA